jgi:bleomycin hydrolase
MLTLDTIKKLRQHVQTDKHSEITRIVTNAVSNASWKELYDTNLLEGAKHIFSHEIQPEPEITNQQDSGRCWIFAGLNLIRRYMIAHYGYDNFEFSQSYIAFYDKLERANYYAYWIKNTLEKNPEYDFSMYNLKYQYWFNTLFDDGGQFIVFAQLVKKYGLMPKEEFEDTYYSANTADFIKMLKDTSTIFMMNCKKNNLKTFDRCREKYLIEIYRLLTQFYGFHYETFLFKYPVEYIENKHKKTKKNKEDDNDVIARVHGGTKKNKKDFNKPFIKANMKLVKKYNSVYVTPNEFYDKYVPVNLENFTSLVNDPRNAFNKMYVIDNLQTIAGGPNISHYNIEMKDLVKIAKRIIDKGNPIWFTCDVGNFIHFEKEIADLNLFDEEKDLGISSIKRVSKKDRLIYGISKLDHAMLLCGYQERPDKSIIRWKVENSWSAAGEGNGFLTISNDWLKEFLYQIVVDLDDLPENLKQDIIKKGKEKKISLPNYDPFGNGAFVN